MIISKKEGRTGAIYHKRCFLIKDRRTVVKTYRTISTRVDRKVVFWTEPSHGEGTSSNASLIFKDADIGGIHLSRIHHSVSGKISVHVSNRYMLESHQSQTTITW